MSHETENNDERIKKIFSDANDEAVIILTYELKKRLKEIKEKKKYDQINLISGMGTTHITIMHKGKEYSQSNRNFPKEVFKEVKEWLMCMAGDYNIYPNDVLV